MEELRLFISAYSKTLAERSVTKKILIASASKSINPFRLFYAAALFFPVSHCMLIVSLLIFINPVLLSYVSLLLFYVSSRIFIVSPLLKYNSLLLFIISVKESLYRCKNQVKK
jgi:hypothetical protein